ncbi:hypothetical protein [Sporomusa malonica]|uniref:Uncharacterized protein n=1 Tax=Sporomusa malonica TaxID=112901 RepID=A0A1W2CAJ0_9FIRM|nr:hypothetical protein [Sporomusa malonica]SMC82151.1 hypothetical protein SAMN04488500_1105 [Sporomusa malonica]
MCEIDELFTRVGDMDRTELAKAYLMALKENADLRRQIQKSIDQGPLIESELTANRGM